MFGEFQQDDFWRVGDLPRGRRIPKIGLRFSQIMLLLGMILSAPKGREAQTGPPLFGIML